MKGLLAVAVVIGAFGVGTTSASADPVDFAAAERQCEAQGGGFTRYTVAVGYECDFKFLGPFGMALSEGQIRAAANLCERAYGGTFRLVPVPAPYDAYTQYYRCLVTPAPA